MNNFDTNTDNLNIKTISITGLEFLNEKFKQRKIKYVILTIFVLLALLFLLIGIYEKSYCKKNAIAFNPIANQTNEIVYLDIKGISGWIIKDDEYDGYYAEAFDLNNYYYIVYLNDRYYSNLNDQYEFAEGISDVEPDVKRVYGKAYPIESNVLRTFIDDGYILNEDDFNSYFGYYYIDFTVDTPLSVGSLLIVFSLLFFIASVVLGFFVIFKDIHFDKSLKELDDDDIFLAASELLEINKYKGIVLTNHFLFDFNKNVFIKFKNILWTYPGVKTTIIPMGILISVRTSKVLNIRTKSLHYQCAIEYKDYIDSKTEGCLKGFDKENKKQFLEAKNNGLVLVKEGLSFSSYQDDILSTNKKTPEIEIVKEKHLIRRNIKRVFEIFFIVLGVIFVLLILLGFLIDDENIENLDSERTYIQYVEKLKNLEIADNQAYNKAYSVLSNQSFNKNFHPNDYYLELETDVSRTITIHANYATTNGYILNFDVEDYGANVIGEWLDWDENGQNIGLALTPSNAGYSVVTITNDYNDDTFKIFVYCK